MAQNNPKCVETAGCNSLFSRKRIKIFLGGLLAVVLCVTIRYCWKESSATAGPEGRLANQAAQQPSQNQNGPEASAPVGTSVPDIVATVNTYRITRQELANDCLRHFGNEVLGSLINRRLITSECQRQGIVVTRREVNVEIEDMAKRFKIPVDQWLEMLHRERNVTPEQYANEIVWPTVALRKLARRDSQVTDDELRQEYETQYGEAIVVRLIAVKGDNPAKAKRLHALVTANPGRFGNVAKEESDDPASAVAMGLINPIRKHGTYKEIEDVVFNMPDGAISPIIEAGGQFVILLREQKAEAGVPPRFEEVESRLKGLLLDRKTRQVAQETFKSLQDAAVKGKAIEKIWDDPEKHRQMPGVAATVYGDPITIRELADECLERHAAEVLDGTISRKIVELECKKKDIAISESDIDKEIEATALEGMRAKPDGSADVDGWLAMVKKRGVSTEVYRRDAIWPAVVLKKLVGKSIAVTDEDLKKGFESNYGERVRCKAIVLNDQRRALEVFDMARKKNTSEYFGTLATQYSVEPGSQRLMGDVPPVRKHCGQEELERQAFALTDGELSGVFQLGDKFVILRYEGRTKPDSNIKFAEVRDLIYQDLYEKKLQIAMAAKFEELKNGASVTNFVAGTTHSPNSTKATPATAKGPSSQPLPYR